MQLTIQAKGKNADSLSWHLGKHPENPYRKETKHGVVEGKFLTYKQDEIEFYLTFRANSLELVKNSDYHQLEEYINDRAFSVSSIFLKNIRNSIGNTLGGGKEGIDETFDLTTTISPISTKLPEIKIKELFEPLGYDVSIRRIESDYAFETEQAQVLELTLQQHTNIVTMMKQIHVLIPVIDNYKHYGVDDQEVEKLLRYGEDWLEKHPLKTFITNRFMRYKQSLIKDAMEVLEQNDQEKEEKEKKERLGDMRYSFFDQKIKDLGVKSVVDMGAGSGQLLKFLVQNEQLEEVIACEPLLSGIERIEIKMNQLGRKGKLKVKPNVFQSSLFYQDERLADKDAILLCEVIEHIDRERIDGVVHNVLSYYHPEYFLMSTPNRDYNAVYELGDKFRHNDHRFEMTREEFKSFVEMQAKQENYFVEIIGIGEIHEEYGQPTQLAIFRKDEKNEHSSKGK